MTTIKLKGTTLTAGKVERKDRFARVMNWGIMVKILFHQLVPRQNARVG